MYLLADQSSNAKLSKNVDINSEWNTSILYLAPADLSGTNLCPGSSPGCRAACLNTAGRGAMNSVQAGRMRKTRLFLDSPRTFMHQLVSDLETLAGRQTRTRIKQAVRLNGTSDIAWEDIPVVRGSSWFRNVMDAFPELMFYDYTKLPTRVAKQAAVGWPPNYRLTFSQSEVNRSMARRIAGMGLNVAVVFAGQKLPPEYHGKPVLDGTVHDMRFLDPAGHVIGLLAKGKAKGDKSGFVVNI